MKIVVVGGGAVGDAVAASIEGAIRVDPAGSADRPSLSRDLSEACAGPSCVVPVVALPPRKALARYDEAGWAEAAERPLRQALVVMQSVRAALAADGGRLLFLLSTTGLSGHDGGVAQASVVEGIRAMAKSAALAWAPLGITVNFLAAPDAALVDPRRVREELGPMVALLSRSVGAMTASTVIVDHGEAMLP